MMQQATRKQAMAFRLPTVQEEVAGWWEAPMSICGLGQQDFMPHHDICGTGDLRETQNEETLALARALQHYMERLGAHTRVLCSMVRDLQRCMEPIMCLKGEDILEASLLRATDNEPGASPILVEETTLLGKDPTPQEAQEAITCSPDFPEETPKPKVTARVGDPLDIQQQIPLLPPGFRPPICVSH